MNSVREVLLWVSNVLLCGYTIRTLWGQVTLMHGVLPHASVTFCASIVWLYPMRTVLSSVYFSVFLYVLLSDIIITHRGIMDKNFNPLTCDWKCGRMRAKITRTIRFLWGLNVSFYKVSVVFKWYIIPLLSTPLWTTIKNRMLFIKVFKTLF